MTPPSPEQRRIAAERFERARQVGMTGSSDYAMHLLLGCCVLDPANLIYRKELRRIQKKKYNDNLRGAPLAFLTTLGQRHKLRSARRKGDLVRVLEHGEIILSRNPWDKSTQLAMAAAAEDLGMVDVAIFILDQARQSNQNDVTVNRALARLLEKRGHFAQAIKLWELVRTTHPADPEAGAKAKDLAASETIRRGHYQEAMASEDPIRGTMHQKKQKEVAERTAVEESKLHDRLSAEPAEPRHYLDAAASLRRAGKLEEAAAMLEKGLSLSGNDFQIQLQLADLHLEPLRKDLVHAEARVKAAPDEAEVRKVRDDLLREINTRELEIFRLKADRLPSEVTSRLELGIRLLRAGQIDEAISELQAVRKDERLHGKASLFLGHCFKSRKNWRLAQRNFEEALQKLPAADEAGRKETLFELATGTAADGDLSKALDYAHELANLDFAYHDINRLMDEWQTKLQKA